jgi:hypothetical protein
VTEDSDVVLAVVDDVSVFVDTVVVEVSDDVLAVFVVREDMVVVSEVSVVEDHVVEEVSEAVVSVVLEERDVSVFVDAVVLEVSVVEEMVVLELPVALKVKLVVDDSVDVVRPSQVSSQIS